MRILHVIANMGSGSGGPTAALRGLAAAQAAQGDEVHVVSVNLDGPPWRPVRAPGGRVREMLDGVAWDFFPGAPPRRWLRSPALARALPAAIAAADAVEIHGLYLHPLLAAGRACRRLGRPYVLRPLGILDPVIQGRRRWRKRIAGWLGSDALLRGAGLIHVTSDAEAAIARPWTGGTPVAIVPHGVTPPPRPDEAALAAARRRWLGDAAGPVLLFLGRLTAKKGLCDLVAALPPLVARWPGLRLLAVGRDEGEGQAARDLAGRLGLARHLVITGQLDAPEVGAALALATLFVLPSRSENFGLAVVEALAAGTPAVISPGVALAPALEAAGAAVVAPPAALAEPLALLLSDAARRAVLAEAGRAAAARYSWAAAAESLRAHYARLMPASR